MHTLRRTLTALLALTLVLLLAAPAAADRPGGAGMSGDPYGARVRALFAGLEHAGELDEATVAEFEEQGVRLRLEARLAGGVPSLCD